MFIFPLFCLTKCFTHQKMVSFHLGKLQNYIDRQNVKTHAISERLVEDNRWVGIFLKINLFLTENRLNSKGSNFHKINAFCWGTPLHSTSRFASLLIQVDFSLAPNKHLKQKLLQLKGEKMYFGPSLVFSSLILLRS